MSETKFFRTYTCKPETLERFKVAFDGNVIETTELYLEGQKCVGLVKVSVVLSEEGYIKPKIGYIDNVKFVGRFKAYVHRVSRDAVYKVDGTYVRGEFLKKALTIMLTDDDKEVELWILTNDTYGERGTLGIGNSDGLILIAPIVREVYEYRDFRQVFKEIEIKVNGKASNKMLEELIEKWIKELGI